MKTLCRVLAPLVAKEKIDLVPMEYRNVVRYSMFLEPTHEGRIFPIFQEARGVDSRIISKDSSIRKSPLVTRRRRA